MGRNEKPSVRVNFGRGDVKELWRRARAHLLFRVKHGRAFMVPAWMGSREALSPSDWLIAVYITARRCLILSVSGRGSNSVHGTCHKSKNK